MAQETVISNLGTENIKLKSEMKLLRDEHTEMLHAMFSQEKRGRIDRQTPDLGHNSSQPQRAISIDSPKQSPFSNLVKGP